MLSTIRLCLSILALVSIQLLAAWLSGVAGDGTSLVLPEAATLDFDPDTKSPPESQGIEQERGQMRRHLLRSIRSSARRGKAGRNPKQPSKHQQKLLAYLNDHGMFTSDTSSCAKIHSKSCSKNSDCRGCLGLYTCRIRLAKCELKGVTRKAGEFNRNIINT